MIYVEDSAIKIGGKLLPGVFKSMEIDGDAKVEEQEVKGSTSKPKQAIGYEDAKITIEIQLDDDYEEKQKRKTTLKKLAVIQSLFKKADQDKPVVYPIINEHTAARGIKQVIFKKLTTKELNSKSTMVVTIELWEYVPMKITAKKAVAPAASAATGTGTTSNANTANTSNLSQDYKNYLGADRGSAPGYSDKTSASPAVDNANTAAALNRLASIPNSVRE